jgi:hypothetical protein
MSDSRQPLQQWIIRGCSRLLLLVGAAVFLIGGKFLYEIQHVSFLVSETIGILAAVVLMLLGAGIAIRGKALRGRNKTLTSALITSYSDGRHGYKS